MQAHSASVRADAVESATLPLLPNENVLTTLEVDLDERLHFARARLQLTEHRLIGERGAWPLRPDLSLRHHDHAGVGTLELHDGSGRLALWRFTLAQNVQALRLVRLFEQRIEVLWRAVRCSHGVSMSLIAPGFAPLRARATRLLEMI